MPNRPVLLSSLCLVFLACAHGGKTPEPHPAFQGLVDDFFAAEYAFFPSDGTAQGLHAYDGALENFAAPRVAARVVELHQFLDRVSALWPQRSQLSLDEQVDLEAIDGRIRAELLDWEDLRFRLRNPMTYAGTPGSALDGLLKRNFAPKAERLKRVVERLRQVPALYAAGKANVNGPPREWTDLALRISSDSVGFFQETVAAWAKDAAGADAFLLADFERANRTAVAATQDWVHFLEKDLKPRSGGSYAIGPEAFAAKLKYEESILLPLDSLLARGEAQLKKDHEAFVATARQIDPDATPEAVMASLYEEHPTAKDLLPTVRRSLEAVRQFVVRKDLVTFPSEERPHVEETPPYARNGSFASMETPGPYETHAKEAYYYVTPPETDWDRQHVEEHLREYNASMLPLIDIHEAYPGHFLQFLWAPKFPTKTRKLLLASSNAEGWAHYTEEMMVDEGFGAGDPKIKLAQLEEALLRDCRYVVGIQLHTGGLTVEEGARRFVKECFQEPANGYEEARRGTYDPTYLYYTFGKLEVQDLRRDWLARKGGTLKEFHDAFVSQGALPVPLVRKLLLR